MRQVATRKYNILKKLEFTVDGEGLPVMEGPTPNRSLKGAEYYAKQIDAKQIIPMIFGNETTMRSYDFKQKALRCIPEITCDTAYLELLKQSYQNNLISKRKINDYETYYDLNTASQQESEISLFWLGAVNPLVSFPPYQGECIHTKMVLNTAPIKAQWDRHQSI